MDREVVNGQIKFIWTGYRPSNEQYFHLEFLQAEIRNYYWQVFEDTDSDYDFAVRLQQMHNRLRNTLHIVK